METSFTPYELGILLPSLLSLLCSLVFFFRGNTKVALGLLTLGAFGIRFFMANLDPFLHDWDEKYHALVAKNLINHPLVPTLIDDPIIKYNYKNWAGNHIWLHKQPLFLWQMALSLKLFGINEIAVRLPSIILGTLQTLLIYKIGKITVNQRVGFVAAFLFSVAYYQLEMTAGAQGREHNDIAFCFYVTTSFWTALEYWYNEKARKWVIWTGIFVGCAIMTKWVVGLLVYAGWGMIILLSPKERFQWKNYLDITLSIMVAVILVLPWQIYIFQAFPVEANFEMEYNSRHFFEVLEQHKTSVWKHFEVIPFLYGKFAYLFIILGLAAMIFKLKRKSLILLFTTLVITYAFYSFAQTRLAGYTYVVSFIIFIAFASLLEWLLEWLEKVPQKHLFITLAVLFTSLAGFSNLRHWKIESYHARQVSTYNKSGKHLKNKEHNTRLYKALNHLPKQYIITNFSIFEEIDIRFYTNHLAYFWIGKEDFERLKKEGYQFAVFQNFKNQKIPSYIKNDPATLIIEKELWK